MMTATSRRGRLAAVATGGVALAKSMRMLRFRVAASVTTVLAGGLIVVPSAAAQPAARKVCAP